MRVPVVKMTTQEKEHVVTAKEATWTEQKHRPGEDGTPEVIPDTLILHNLDSGPMSKYSCSCGAELRNWAQVKEHFEKVANGQESSTRRSTPRQNPDNQATLDDI